LDKTIRNRALRAEWRGMKLDELARTVLALVFVLAVLVVLMVYVR
jgi:hypothetical protein